MRDQRVVNNNMWVAIVRQGGDHSLKDSEEVPRIPVRIFGNVDRILLEFKF